MAAVTPAGDRHHNTCSRGTGEELTLRLKGSGLQPHRKETGDLRHSRTPFPFKAC